jgi:hypothetical protein
MLGAILILNILIVGGILSINTKLTTMKRDLMNIKSAL